MARWVGTVNAKEDFDIEKAVEELDIIYWGKNHYKFSIGDVFFMYVTAPVQSIRYKFEVVSIIPYETYPSEQRKYWRSKRYLNRKGEEHLGLRLLAENHSNDLSLDNFRSLGFIGANEIIQGRRNDKQYEAINQNTMSWFDYIDQYFQDTRSYDFPEEAYVENQMFPEGGKKQIVVNIYERDFIARQKCIEIHGLNCSVCQMNFGQTYGAFAEGFIHVHHLKPLHKIKENYQVDPRKDLIPVCPNCHAMLHRKIDGVEMTVEKLKLFYK